MIDMTHNSYDWGSGFAAFDSYTVLFATADGWLDFDTAQIIVGDLGLEVELARKKIESLIYRGKNAIFHEFGNEIGNGQLQLFSESAYGNAIFNFDCSSHNGRSFLNIKFELHNLGFI